MLIEVRESRAPSRLKRIVIMSALIGLGIFVVRNYVVIEKWFIPTVITIGAVLLLILVWRLVSKLRGRNEWVEEEWEEVEEWEE